MQALLVDLVLCLIVMFMPVTLLYVSAFVYVYEYCEDAGLLILLNSLLAIAIVTMVTDRQISTFAVIAVVGYSLVVAAITAVVAGLLFLRIRKWFEARSRLRLIEFREEQSTLSQSFLPY